MEEKSMICVNCPKGCTIHLSLENGEITDVKGYSCEQGKNYAIQETIRPLRVLTSTVKLINCHLSVLPVITDQAIPLDRINEAMEEIRKLSVSAPVQMGQVLVENFLDTGCNLVAARSVHI